MIFLTFSLFLYWLQTDSKTFIQARYFVSQFKPIGQAEKRNILVLHLRCGLKEYEKGQILKHIYQDLSTEEWAAIRKAHPGFIYPKYKLDS